MLKKIIYIFLLTPLIGLSQTNTENYSKTTNYREEYRGDYPNFTLSLGTSDFILTGNGGASGSVKITDNLLTVNFSGSWSAQKMKSGTIKTLNVFPKVSNLDLGSINHLSTGVPTGYFAKIENNNLIFYSPYFLDGVNTDNTYPINATGVSYTTSLPNPFVCNPSGGGGAGGSITVSNNTVRFYLNGSWATTCNLKTGQILNLAPGVSLPDTYLGVIKSNLGLDTAYKAKIENNWLVFYTDQTIPSLPVSGTMNFTKDLGGGINGKQSSVTYFDGIGRKKQQIQIAAGGTPNKVNNNLLPWKSSWTTGSGSVGVFQANGTVAENNRVNGLNPFGENTVLWKCGSDPDNDWDGGWNTSNLQIDHKKAYRYSVWVKRKNSLQGNAYHGTANVVHLDGTPDNYPYFWWGGFRELDTWYLLVGYIHPSNYTGSYSGISGVYDTNGNKVEDGTDYKWIPGQTSSYFRSYMFYATDVNSEQYFYAPTLQVIDGTEASLSGLLQNVDIPDLVSYFEYDNFGRESKKYLTYASSNSSKGEFYSNAKTDLINFYNNSKFDNTLNPYSESKFEASSLDRVLEIGQPGNDWKIDPISDSDNTVKFDYLFNNASDKVKLFNVSIDASNNYSLVDTGSFYNDRELTKSVLKNENWKPSQTDLNNNTSITFKDKSGKIVLKRDINNGKWHDTYNVFDVYGNLAYVLPPMVNTYDASQQLWQTQGTYLENINSIYSTPASNYNEFQAGIYNGNMLYVYLDDNGGPTATLNTTGPAIHLNFNPPLPDMSLGSVYIKQADGSLSDSHYEANIQNGDIYFSGDQTAIAYGQVYFEFSIDLSVNANFQAPAVSTMLADLAYQYKYDNKNRLIEKKLPGKEPEYVVYDKLDRPILTQDGNLRIQNKWLFVKYDAFDRIAYSGIWSNPNSGQNRDVIQQIVDNQSVSLWSEVKNSTSQNVGLPSTTLYYSNTLFPTSNIELLNIIYYDSYNFDFVGLGSETSFGVYPTTNVKTLPTGTKTKVLGTSSWITSVSYYDDKGRAIYNASYNSYLNIIDKVKSKFDFVGNVLETESLQSKGTFQAVVKDKFTYDHLGRLLTQKQQINSQDEQLLLKNNYDDLGRLISRNVGGKTIVTGEQGLQKVDLSYNVRGWLKGINDVAKMENDLFAIKYYHQENNNNPNNYTGAPGQNLFNSNISATEWKTDNISSSVKAYYYSYDNLDRLTTAQYTENGVINYKFNEQIPEYDRNGNILQLTRYAINPSNPTYASVIDNLAYSYNGNKLLSVSDGYRQIANGDKGFNDGNFIGDDYSYDDNSNMIVDKNKGITLIEYNHLNLPTKIVFSNADLGTANPRVITYKYNAAGVKIEKTVYEPVGTPLTNTITTTQYNGGAVYKNNVLEFFSQSEGYVAYDGSAVGDKYTYVFQYKDNVGNVRLSYKDIDGNGVITGATTEVFSDGFESASGWDNQGFSWGWPITSYDNSKSKSGLKSGRIDNTNSGGTVKAIHSNTWTTISNTQPTDYIFSGWVYNASSYATIFMFMSNDGETGYPANFDWVRTFEKNKWVYIEKKITVPANFTKLNLRIDNNGTGTVWFDNVSIRKVNATNEIVEENNFYPFGLKHEGYNNIVNGFGNSNANKYRLTGKEYQDELSLNTYDFGARNYDPAIGRWSSFDPLSEKAYNLTPYRYSFNNPNLFNDPTGMYEDDFDPASADPGDPIGGWVTDKNGLLSFCDTCTPTSVPEGLSWHGYTATGGFRDMPDLTGSGGSNGTIQINGVSVSGTSSSSGYSMSKGDNGFDGDDYLDDLSDLWNGPIARMIVPDRLYIGVSYNFGVGLGTSGDISLNWITRGHDASFVPYTVTTIAGTASIGYNASLNFNYGGGLYLTSDMRSLEPGKAASDILGAGGFVSGSVAAYGLRAAGTVSASFSGSNPFNPDITWITYGQSVGVSVPGASGTVGYSNSFRTFGHNNKF